MQTKQFWINFILMFSYVFNKINLFFWFRYFLDPIVIKRLVWIGHHIRIQKPINKRAYEPFVFVICDSPTVVNNCRKDANDRELQAILLINHHPQLVFSHKQVSVGKILGRWSPADWPEFFSINQQGVEQRAAEQHSLEQRRVAARLQIVVVEVIVGVEHDLLDISRGLDCHLDAVL